MTRARTRHGNILVLVAVLCMLAFVGLSSMDYLTRGDMTSTAAYLRELYATYIGESIAAQIEARVNSRPWEDRFWERENQAKGTPDAPVQFSKASGHLKITADGVPDGDFDYLGIVKDLRSGGLHDYRIYVEVSVQSSQFTFSWDKRSSESLLTGLNRDASRLDKHLEDATPGAPPTDTMLDNIKEASNVPGADGLSTSYADLLERLHGDSQLFQGGTELPPKPEEPIPPPPPTYDPSNPPPSPPASPPPN